MRECAADIHERLRIVQTLGEVVSERAPVQRSGRVLGGHTQVRKVRVRHCQLAAGRKRLEQVYRLATNLSGLGGVPDEAEEAREGSERIPRRG